MKQSKQTHRRIPTTLRAFSAADKEFFAREGYLIVEDVFDASLVDTIRNEITRIVVRGSDEEGLVQIEPSVASGELVPADKELGVRKLFRMAKYNEFFKELAFHPGMLSLVVELFGSDLKLVQSMLLMKPPYVSEPKVWHQDNAYFRLKPNDVVGWWIALDPTDIANGCMHVIPGSHRRGIDSHEGTGDLYGLSKQPSFEEALAIPLQAGDGLLFHGELHHGTPANATKTRRRALQYHYASGACRSRLELEREIEVVIRRHDSTDSI